ncbi:MAG: DUF6886 family protein [Dehalococcoidia bacterium]
MNIALYHFSEDPNIERFAPHRAPTSVQDEERVWAIDAWHAPMYYVPRDCPRACFWPGPQTSDEDRERWFGGIDARMVIAVEMGWLARIRSATLYRYAMPEETFALDNATAGHWDRSVIHDPASSCARWTDPSLRSRAGSKVCPYSCRCALQALTDELVDGELEIRDGF